jgi:hypothetical protein
VLKLCVLCFCGCVLCVGTVECCVLRIMCAGSVWCVLCMLRIVLRRCVLHRVGYCVVCMCCVLCVVDVVCVIVRSMCWVCVCWVCVCWVCALGVVCVMCVL